MSAPPSTLGYSQTRRRKETPDNILDVENMYVIYYQAGAWLLFRLKLQDYRFAHEFSFSKAKS